MISCTDFIPAYNELFKELHHRGGKEEVVRFWEYLSDNFLNNLRKLAEEKGLRGCWEYWGNSLNEEAADFTMSLDEEGGEFRIDMHHCPSMGRLLESEQAEPYEDYCEHCDTLYRRVLEPLGFECDIDMSECHKAKCCITVKQKIDKGNGSSAKSMGK